MAGASSYPETSFVAGDSVDWLKSGGDYPPPTWTLTYQFTSFVLGKFELTAVDDGDGNHRLVLNSSDTEALTSGRYNLFALFSDGTDRYTQELGEFWITPNPATAGSDFRSTARKTLDALEAMLEGRGGKDTESYSIEGRSLSRISIEDLQYWRDRLRQEVRVEQDRITQKKGGRSRRQIYAEFR